MNFYLKSWFIILLLIISTGLLFSVLYLFDVVEQVNIFQPAADATVQPAPEIKVIEADSDQSPERGNPEARIKVVGWFDFQCRFCREAYFILEELFAEHPEDIYFQYRNYVLNETSRDLAEASLCAGEQGRFWEYYSLLFENQSIVNADILNSFAAELGIDQEQFSICLISRKYAGQVNDDYQDAVRLGVIATPTFFINGRKVQGALPKEIWEKVIREVR